MRELMSRSKKRGGLMVALVAAALICAAQAGANTAPVASDGSVTTNQDTPVGGTLFASDAESSPLTYSIVASPQKGAVEVSSASVITTVAGTGTGAFGGDGGPATSAQLYRPYGVAVDSAGNVYIGDYNNHRVRKVSAAGTITTVAGTGTSGYSGDGGSSTLAKLYYPRGVAVDAAGNVYIADSYNHRIRKVSATGTITTVAGTGTGGYSGDGGLAISAKLNRPYGVAVDSAGNLYIADYYNNRVRKVSATGAITTVAGTGSGGYSGDGGAATSALLYNPAGVAVDSAGNVYIADYYNNRVRKVSAAGIITTFAGTGISGYSGDGGPAASAQINNPYGVAVDSAGNVYIADTYAARVRKVSATGFITTVAGNGSGAYSGDGGPATSAGLYEPRGAAVDAAGNLYIADSRHNCIRKVSTTGIITTIAGTGTAGFGGGRRCRDHGDTQ